MKRLSACILIATSIALCGAPAPKILTGPVSDVAQGDGLTYVRINRGEDAVWAYGPRADVRLLDRVTIPLDDKKRRVKSKDLDHTFRDIYFVKDLAATVDLAAREQALAETAEEDAADGPELPRLPALPAGHPRIGSGVSGTAPSAGDAVQGMPARLPAGHPAVGGKTGADGPMPTGHSRVPGGRDLPAGMPPGHPRTGAGAADGGVLPPAIEPATVTKADGGYTIAELIEQRKTLAGESVVIRGQVIRVNPNIMGRNWIHIRDGSTDPERDDLTVTTEEDMPDLGQIVLLRGTVAVDVPLGHGAARDLLIEKAAVVKE